MGAVALPRRRSSYGELGAPPFLMSSGADGMLIRWRLPTLAGGGQTGNAGQPIEIAPAASAQAHASEVNGLSLSPDDSVAVTCSLDRTARLWLSADLTARGTLSGHRRGVWAASFSPVDRVLATGSADRTVRIWSATTHACLR